MVYEETKYIMNKNKILANKSLGQNFLIDDKIIEKIMDSAEIKKNDLIIEIGPGLGTLTKELLKKAGKVIAIEIDKRMINILADRFSTYKNLEIINEDVLKVDLDKLIKNELPIRDLSEEELEEMIEYFKNDIKSKEEELKQLKKQIAELKKENKEEKENESC